MKKTTAADGKRVTNELTVQKFSQTSTSIAGTAEGLRKSLQELEADLKKDIEGKKVRWSIAQCIWHEHHTGNVQPGMPGIQFGLRSPGTAYVCGRGRALGMRCSRRVRFVGCGGCTGALVLGGGGSSGCASKTHGCTANPVLHILHTVRTPYQQPNQKRKWTPP